MKIMSDKHVLLFHMDSLSHPGGAEKVLCDMANALVGLGWKVDVIGWDHVATELPFPVAHEVGFINAALQAPFFLRDSSLLDRFCGCFGVSKERRHELRRLKTLAYKARYVQPLLDAMDPKVIVAFSPEAHYLLRKHLDCRKPMVVTLHEGPKKRFARKHTGALKETLEEADAVQVLLPEYADELQKHFTPRKMVVIPNAVPQYASVSNLTSSEIICVGRLYPSKRQDLLIEAFYMLAPEYPQWRVKLLGGAPKEDPYPQKLRSLIGQRGLQDQVILAGVSEHVDQELLKASIFAFPTANEGFSLALTEAMSAGLPVVACRDCESICAMLNASEARLVEPNATSLAQALRELMESFSLRKEMGQRCKEHAKRYAPQEVWGAWDAILAEMLRKVS